MMLLCAQSGRRCARTAAVCVCALRLSVGCLCARAAAVCVRALRLSVCARCSCAFCALCAQRVSAERAGVERQMLCAQLLLLLSSAFCGAAGLQLRLLSVEPQAWGRCSTARSAERLLLLSVEPQA